MKFSERGRYKFAIQENINGQDQDVRDKEISERKLKRKKAEIRKVKSLNPKTKINKILFQVYKFTRHSP